MNFIKKYLTQTLVAIFIIILITAAYDAHSAEDSSPDVNNQGVRISLGHTVFNSYDTYGNFGYEYKGFELAGSLQGTETDDVVKMGSFSYLTRPDWHFLGAQNYYRIGVAYVDGSDLVGSGNYKLGVGLQWDVFAVEYFHYSSAGINSTNSGIDGVKIRYMIPSQ